MPTLDRIAKTIVGPNEVHHLGIAKLTELQDLKWGRLKAQEQAHFLRSARYLQALFESEPDGWVILNGDDTKARQQEFNDLTSTYVTWTDDLDKAVWFARRDDAEQFARDDDDAWHIRRASEVRLMWGSRPAAGPPPVSGIGDPVGVDRSTGAIVARPDIPPQPAMLPCDQRSTQHLLFLLRGFVNRNVVTWMNGACDHHHPIWQDVAADLDQYDLNYYPTSGPDYQFIQPLNRESHAVLLEEFVAKGGDVADSQQV